MFCFGLGGFGFTEMLVVFVIVLLVFGSHRVPEMFRNFGRAINEFKKGMHEIEASAPPPPAHPAEIAMRPPQQLPATPPADPHGTSSH